jgi:hypothetical protein
MNGSASGAAARIGKGKISPDAVADETLALVVDWH